MSIRYLDFRSANQTGDRIQFRSIAVDILSQHFAEAHPIQLGIFDFAPADNGVIQHFAIQNCIYYSTQLIYDSFFDAEKINSQANLTHLLNNLLLRQLDKNKNCVPLGAVLVWDIFNYCSRAQIIEIMSAISLRCTKGTKLHALLWQTEKIPSLPGRFTVTTNRKIEYQFNTDEKTYASFLAAQTIIDMMPSFKACRMSASDSGILEVILEFDELAEPPYPTTISSSLLTGIAQ